jgi:hypothetical protein
MKVTHTPKNLTIQELHDHKESQYAMASKNYESTFDRQYQSDHHSRKQISDSLVRSNNSTFHVVQCRGIDNSRIFSAIFHFCAHITDDGQGLIIIRENPSETDGQKGNPHMDLESHVFHIIRPFRMPLHTYDFCLR